MGSIQFKSLTDAVIQTMIHAVSLTSIRDEFARLSSTERVMLIDILWESLDDARVKELEAKWAAESEERIDAVDRGELQTIDGPSVLRHLRSSLRNDTISCHHDRVSTVTR